MPIRYEIHEGYVEEWWHDVVTTDDVRAHYGRLLADEVAMSRRRSVARVHITEAIFNGMDLEELIRSVVRPAIRGLGWRTAALTTSQLDFGLARQFGHIAADVLDLRVYGHDAESEAMQWLLTGRG